MGLVNDTPAIAPLLVPASAVLQTGRRAVVYVADNGTERPTFQGREITLGPRAGNYFVVTAGLEAGERVVSHGAFKIDSALQIQAKPSMMNPAGGGPVPGHNHGSAEAVAAVEADDPHAGHAQSGPVELSGDLLGAVIPPYLAMQSALANFASAQSAARTMMGHTGHAGSLPDLLHRMLEAEDIEALRRPLFDHLSQIVITAAKADPTALPQDLLVMHCPMVYDEGGADWLQATEPLLNPYFGAMMLRCGSTKETLSATQSAPNGHAH